MKAGRRRIFLTGFACLFLGLLVGRGSSWVDFGPNDFWPGGPPPVGWSGHSPVVATATELFEAYRDNKAVAGMRFSNRPLVVTGNVVRVDPHPQFGPDILLSTSDPAKPLRVDLLRESHDASASLERGAAVTVGCERVEEYIGPDPWLRNCRIQEAGGALSAPSQPAAVPAKPPKSS